MNNNKYIIQNTYFKRLNLDFESIARITDNYIIWNWANILLNKNNIFARKLLEYGINIDTEDSTIYKIMTKSVLVNSKINISWKPSLHIILAIINTVLKDQYAYEYGYEYKYSIRPVIILTNFEEIYNYYLKHKDSVIE